MTEVTIRMLKNICRSLDFSSFMCRASYHLPNTIILAPDITFIFCVCSHCYLQLSIQIIPGGVL